MSAAKPTPLYERHVALGARMTEFAGWLMPVQYTGVVEEHQNTRNNAGLFDLYHMGEIRIHGSAALEAVQHLTTNDASRLVPGDAQYSLLCRPDGGIIDDIIVYRLQTGFRLVVNAANAKKDYEWICENLPSGAEAVDESEEIGLIALQGPKAETILSALTAADLAGLYFFHFREEQVAGVPTLISRTGYTGEDGFELYFPVEHARKLWDELLAAGEAHGLKPVGLGARDTLRLEMKYSLYGNDITEETNPIEAGLGWAVKLKKGDFIGREAIRKVKENGPSRKLIGLEMTGRGVARTGYPIFSAGKQVGKVTSGSFSPTLNKSIGLGYVGSGVAAVGTELTIGIRNRQVGAVIVPTPFVKSKTKVERRK